ncbi:hypothetical protein OGAPHI_001937 [Ogataea philodendri]|uniref:Uncharacterized protein n=1 Tax=Ogataea philodendri TaxID=1378263 RepID=A0A9P8P9H4_9ASCO|nr:uncharacterized protein OGAPHI_001937 [Ogataea philodendri]KAH3668183.1 hypothetical protein OGAPHI_001937 [Ogataea philodendri]
MLSSPSAPGLLVFRYFLNSGEFKSGIVVKPNWNLASAPSPGPKPVWTGDIDPELKLLDGCSDLDVNFIAEGDISWDRLSTSCSSPLDSARNGDETYFFVGTSSFMLTSESSVVGTSHLTFLVCLSVPSDSDLFFKDLPLVSSRLSFANPLVRGDEDNRLDDLTGVLITSGISILRCFSGFSEISSKIAVARCSVSNTKLNELKCLTDRSKIIDESKRIDFSTESFKCATRSSKSLVSSSVHVSSSLNDLRRDADDSLRIKSSSFGLPYCASRSLIQLSIFLTSSSQ